MINSPPGKVHDEIDFAAIQLTYDDAIPDEGLRGQNISGPYDLYSVETLRDQHGLRRPPGTPTDAFVFAEGEPSKRQATKIGGLPYWPAAKSWPTNADGSPMWFLAQINFGDSLDLVPKLPGEVLLILTEDEAGWCHDDCKSMHFIWENVTDQELISPQDFPEFDYEYTHFDGYGVIHRTADYPEASAAAEELDVRDNYCLAVLPAVKIGGVPDHLYRENVSNGVYIAQLASVAAVPKIRYPWANREMPYDRWFGENSAGNYSMMIGDMGTLHLFLRPDGTVTCSGETN